MTLLPGEQPVEIFVVDDNPGDIALVRAVLAQAGWKVQVRVARDGAEALSSLAALRPLPDVILSDLQMPRMNGMQLVEEVRQHYPSIPVILMTAFGSEEIAVQALLKGAASYVPKKSMTRYLAERLQQVLDVAQETQEDVRLFECLTQTESLFILDNDPHLISPVVRRLGEDYHRMLRTDETDQMRLSIALAEALTNAMFHGNLELESDLREDEPERYRRLAEERRRLRPYSARRVHLRSRLTPTEAVYVIRDEGIGFDPSGFGDPRDRSNLERVSGRGLFLIRLFMDDVHHNEAGNELTMIKRLVTGTN